MSDDLSKRLRDALGVEEHPGELRFIGGLAVEAADRIDALTAERDALINELSVRQASWAAYLVKAGDQLRKSWAENAALRARLETPGEEALDRLVATLRGVTDADVYAQPWAGPAAADALTALRADLAEARAAAQLGLDMARANDLYHTAEKIARALAPKEPPHAE